MTQLEVSHNKGVMVVKMSPPGGFMDNGTVTELHAVIETAGMDNGIRAIVLTGAVPGLFIRHFSVAQLAGMSDQMRARGTSFSLDRPVKERDIDRLFALISMIDKPVIAAINGTAMGGGFELALACDIRVAEAGHYQLGLPEVRLGILPGAGGTQRLVRMVGAARAMELALRGRTVSPEEAHALGLVQQVADSALGAAMAMAEDIAARPPRAIAHIKRLIRREGLGPLDAGLSAERTLFLDLMVTDDANRLMHEFNAGGASLDHFTGG